MTKTKRAEHLRSVAAAIVRQLPLLKAPWQTPWEAGLPRNLVSQKPYRGCNAVWLMTRASECGYRDPRWGTFLQINQAGGTVRKGERGKPILFIKSHFVADPMAGLFGEDSEVWKVVPKLRKQIQYWAEYRVFNVEQAVGLELPSIPAKDWRPHVQAEDVIRSIGVPIVHSTRHTEATYYPGRDVIHVPPRAVFPTADSYYRTVLHELAHATGHPSRMKRECMRDGTKKTLSRSPRACRQATGLGLAASAARAGCRGNMNRIWSKGRIYRDRQERYTDAHSGREITRLTGYLGHSWQLYFTHPVPGGRRRRACGQVGAREREQLLPLRTRFRGAGATHRLHGAEAVRGMPVAGHHPPVLLARCHAEGAGPRRSAGPAGQRGAGADAPQLRLPDQRHRRRHLRVRPAHGQPRGPAGELLPAVRTSARSQLVRIDVAGGDIKVLHEDRRYITHVNTSSTRSDLLTVCHEGPWECVEQSIWGLNVETERCGRSDHSTASIR